MLIKILGTLDTIAGLLFLSTVHLNIASNSFIAFFAMYLILKGASLMFAEFDIMSLLDIIAGFIMLISIILTIPVILIYIISAYLIAKGLASLL